MRILPRLKRNFKILTHTMTESKNVLSERSQTLTDIYFMIPIIRNV